MFERTKNRHIPGAFRRMMFRLLAGVFATVVLDVGFGDVGFGKSGAMADDVDVENWRDTARYVLSPNDQDVFRWEEGPTFRFIGTALDFQNLRHDLSWINDAIAEHDDGFKITARHHINTDYQDVGAFVPLLGTDAEIENRHNYGFSFRHEDGSSETLRKDVVMVIAPRDEFEIPDDLISKNSSLLGFQKGYFDCIVAVRAHKKRIFTAIILIADEAVGAHRRECIYEETTHVFGLMRDKRDTQYFTFDDQIFPNRRENDRVLLSALYGSTNTLGASVDDVMVILDQQMAGRKLHPIN